MARPKAPPAAPATPDEIEQQFYEALQNGDIEQLMGLWADDDDIVCIYPGGPRLVGHSAIRAGFEAVLSHGAIDVRPDQVRRLHAHGCVVHSVLERVPVMTDEGIQTAWIVATNVYVETVRGWRLAAHHASPGSPHEAQESAESGSVLH